MPFITESYLINHGCTDIIENNDSFLWNTYCKLIVDSKPKGYIEYLGFNRYYFLQNGTTETHLNGLSCVLIPPFSDFTFLFHSRLTHFLPTETPLIFKRERDNCRTSTFEAKMTFYLFIGSLGETLGEVIYHTKEERPYQPCLIAQTLIPCNL